MKRIFSVVLSVVILLSLSSSTPVSVFANAADYEDLIFTLSEDKKSYSVSSANKEMEGELVIPNEYEGLPVTKIDSYGFNSTYITKVVIPDSVTTIGSEAFNNCIELKEIVMSKNIEYVGNWCFNKTAFYNNEDNWENGVLYCGSLLIEGKVDFEGTLKIKNGTKSVADSAFRFRENLKEVVFPNSLTHINNTAFYGCALTNVVLSEGLEFIGSASFGGNQQLIEVSIPKSVKVIDNDSFVNCEKLATVKYSGSKDDWKNVSVGEYNKHLLSAKLICDDEEVKITLKAPVITTAKATTKGVKLDWDTVENAAEYKVYRKSYNTFTKKWDSKWKKIQTVKGPEFIDGTVELGTKYKYLIKAVNGDVTKNSKSTSEINFKITPTPKAYIKAEGIKIKWSQVASADEYRIYRAEYNSSTKKWSSYKKVKTAKYSSTEWTDKKVTSGKKYKYCIKAVNGEYVTPKKESNSLYFLTKTTVTLSKAKTGIKVSWTAVKGASKYRVYRSELQNGVWSKFTEIATPTSKSKSYTDTKVVSGVQYKYKVKAVKDKIGQISFETDAYLYLQAPVVTVVNDTDGINVSWSETTGATEYVVYRKTYDAKKKKWSGLKYQATLKGTEWKDVNAKSGTKYKYCVRAVNGNASSAYLSSETVKK